MRFATQRAELAANQVQMRTLDGRRYLVAPVTAVREMVLKGELLEYDEIQAAAPAFNGRPLPVGHPVDDEGNFISANSTELWESANVGWFFEAEADSDTSSLIGLAFVDIDKSNALAEEVDEVFGQPLAWLAAHLDDDAASEIDVFANAPDDDIMDVSTAYWYVPNESATGIFEGQKYTATQHALRPDHLALLPGGEGECSSADGCGIRPPEANSTTGGNGQMPTRIIGAEADGGSATTPSFMAQLRGGLSKLGFGEASGCGCGCGGNCNMDINQLSEATGISVETLEAMSDDERSKVVELAGQSDGDGDGGDGTKDGQNDGGDGDGDGTPPVDDATAEVIEELRSEVSKLRETVEAQEADERQTAVETIEANTSMTADDLEGVPTATLEKMAAEAAPAQGADWAAFGGPVDRGTTGENDAEEFEGLSARLRGTADGQEADD